MQFGAQFNTYSKSCEPFLGESKNSFLREDGTKSYMFGSLLESLFNHQVLYTNHVFGEDDAKHTFQTAQSKGLRLHITLFSFECVNNAKCRNMIGTASKG